MQRERTAPVRPACPAAHRRARPGHPLAADTIHLNSCSTTRYPPPCRYLTVVLLIVLVIVEMAHEGIDGIEGHLWRTMTCEEGRAGWEEVIEWLGGTMKVHEEVQEAAAAGADLRRPEEGIGVDMVTVIAFFEPRSRGLAVLASSLSSSSSVRCCRSGHSILVLAIVLVLPLAGDPAHPPSRLERRSQKLTRTKNTAPSQAVRWGGASWMDAEVERMCWATIACSISAAQRNHGTWHEATLVKSPLRIESHLKRNRTAGEVEVKWEEGNRVG
ncbi:hypothetical protein EW146_g9324 [Bondarzewia mesenterica]|uniref:Uncharacterized protein n=1 Tax=Bondarzewia mesenterica TaxID=1095465 RepID=A0A4S4L798_9AGAM|nr:hypothetical protein EW146_g9324 [Bondarzewia mesenterica]